MPNPPASDFPAFAAARRARVEAALARTTADEIGLAAAARDALLAGGKRLRPLALYCAGEAFGGKPDALTPAAAALECVHAASLALDDLPAMDDAATRRGRPALHKAHGEAAAILAATGLIAEAFERIAASELSARVRAEAAGLLARAIGLHGLSAGQALDLASAQPVSVETLEATHRLKTAALFVAALDIGGLCAGASRHEREILRAYGRDLGLAYQVIDDLLDAEGDPALTGKPKGQDAGRTTFHSLLGGDGSRALARELTDAALSHLAPLGKRATRLKALAELLVQRNA